METRVTDAELGGRTPVAESRREGLDLGYRENIIYAYC